MTPATVTANSEIGGPGGEAPRLLPAFCLGLLAAAPCAELPAAWALLALLAALGWLQRRYPLTRPLAVFLLGFIWSWLHAQWALSEVLPAGLEGRDLVLEGTVMGLPRVAEASTRFLLRARVVEPPGVSYSAVVRLNWYRTAPTLRAGERWRVTARLKMPHGFANPGGFDLERWLMRRGIRATGYVKQAQGNRRLAAAGWGLAPLRQAIAERLDGLMPPGPAAGLIPALVLGERSGLDRDAREVLSLTGTNHLLAISGLHVGIVAGLAFFLLRRLWRRFPAWCLGFAADRAGAVAALTAAGGYAALAGFSISTQRALVMLAVVFGAIALRRTLRPGRGLLTALALVLVWDPMSALAVGFWLSFGAVAVLVYGMSGRLGRGGVWFRWGRAQWAVALGLLPLLLLLFGRASLISPLVNFVAVPVFSVLLLPLVLAVAAAALAIDAAWPLLPAAQLLNLGYGGLSALSRYAWSAWAMPEQPWWVWSAAFLGVVLLLAPRGLPGRGPGLVLLLPLALVRPPPPAPGAFEFTLLDVGQGLAAVVRTRAHVLVYDTGPGFSGGFNTGAAVVAPFLRARGVAAVDTLMVSHADKDHAGGVRGLLDALPVGRVLSGEPESLGVARAQACRAGMRWRWDGVDFAVLHPDRARPAGGNDRSCVLKVTNAAGSVLLTGDVETAVEARLVEALGAGLRSRVLVAGHHGSNTSTSPAFLAAVKPEVVLYSAGYRNRYGFPRAEVRRRVSESGAEQRDTIGSGALTLSFTDSGSLRGPFGYRRP